MENLFAHCSTERQREILAARISAGSNREAGRILGVNESLVRKIISLLQRRSEGKPGWTPVEVTEHLDEDGNLTGKSVKMGPESVEDQGGLGRGDARDGTGPYVVKGVSTYYNANGEQRGQWVKTRIDDLKRDTAMRAALDAMATDMPRVKPVVGPPPSTSKLCNVFTITDYHVGALAWDREGGADWDVNIAESTLAQAFDRLIVGAPRARVAVINQLGDFLHTDGLTAETPTSGHALDADSRFRKIVEVAIRILRRAIDVALMTHDEVHVVMAEGNHDIASSVWLQVMFAALYENEPRVTVNDSALPYYVYRFGTVMLAFHHGHLKKSEALPLLFAASYPVMWGETAKRYAHIGHRHHGEEKEHSGMKVVQHPTLAARDAYAARGGWLSERQASAITYHEDYGEVARNTVTPEMLLV